MFVIFDKEHYKCLGAFKSRISAQNYIANHVIHQYKDKAHARAEYVKAIQEDPGFYLNLMDIRTFEEWCEYVCCDELEIYEVEVQE